MSTLVVLAAGPATRLDGAFKPSVVVGGRTMLDWQRRAAETDDVLLVQHVSQPRIEGVRKLLLDDRSGGPVQGLHAALEHINGPVLVAYADTWWATTPRGSNWVGVKRVRGGRVWDYVGYSALKEATTWNRDMVGPQTRVKACVGLYAFSDLDAVRAACEDALDGATGEVHMIEMLRRYQGDMSLRPIPDWLDAGDHQSRLATDALLSSEVVSA